MNVTRNPNRLFKSTSPYLQQHAYNPVDWFPWSDEALQKARAEQKLIFLSIGYASCHWCHVMERESFENEDVARLLNTHFVPIKVDREERPDLDAVYMEAVQLMTGSGGWPLNIWLTPDLDPVFGGTYFPPEPNYRLPGFSMVLERLLSIAQTDPEKMNRQGASMRAAMQRDIMESLRVHPQKGISPLQAAAAVANQMDKKNGGFGSAPKFPNTMALHFLSEAASVQNEISWLRLVQFSLRQMYFGGIYDQIGGGLARYSTDARWLVPHFEKMLYDQALLLLTSVSLLKQLPDASISLRMRQTLAFLEREMKTEDGAYASAIDADSEGEEGKFYVWKKSEIETCLTTDEFELASRYFGLTEEGNWEEHTILEVIDRGLEEQSALDKPLFLTLESIRKKLLIERSKRIRPITDTKNILAWNALLLKAFASVARFSGEVSDQQRMMDLALAIRKNHKKNDHWFRIYHQKEAAIPAFLDDTGLLISAFLDVYEVSGEIEWFAEARELSRVLVNDFYDGDGGFYFVKKGKDEVPFKTRDVFDNAVPGGFSSALLAIQHLNRHVSEPELTSIMKRSFEIMSGMASENPLSFGNLMRGLLLESVDRVEWVVIGPQAASYSKTLQKKHSPGSIVVWSEQENADHPLFEGKVRPDALKTFVWECRNSACGLPVEVTSGVERKA